MVLSAVPASLAYRLSNSLNSLATLHPHDLAILDLDDHADTRCLTYINAYDHLGWDDFTMEHFALWLCDLVSH